MLQSKKYRTRFADSLQKSYTGASTRKPEPARKLSSSLFYVAYIVQRRGLTSVIASSCPGLHRRDGVSNAAAWRSRRSRQCRFQGRFAITAQRAHYRCVIPTASELLGTHVEVGGAQRWKKSVGARRLDIQSPVRNILCVAHLPSLFPRRLRPGKNANINISHSELNKAAPVEQLTR